MPELERLLADARPRWPDPPPGLEARLLASLEGETGRRSPAAWLRRGAGSRRARLTAVALAVVGSGTALAVAIAGQSGSPGGASASLSFGAPVVVGEMSGYLDRPPVIAVDAAGVANVVWSRAGRVIVTTRGAGGAWSPPLAISRPDRRASAPQVAAGRSGAVAVWRERIRGRAVSERFTLPGGRGAGTLTVHSDVRWRVMAASQEGPGRWGAPTALSTPSRTGRDAYAPQVVATGAGEVVVGYVAQRRLWTVRRAPGGRWDAPRAMPLPAGSGEPFGGRLVAAPASGWVLATWTSYRNDPLKGQIWRVWSAVRAPGGAWQGPTALAAPSPGRPDVAGAINDQGEAVVEWINGTTTVATRDRSGAWSAPKPIESPPGSRLAVAFPAAGIDASGGAVVSTPGAEGSALARRRPGGDWEPARTFRPGALILAIAGDEAGGVLVAAGTRDGGTHLQAFARDGSPRGSVTVGRPPGTSLSVGADGTSALVGTMGGLSRTAIVARVAPAGERR